MISSFGERDFAVQQEGAEQPSLRRYLDTIKRRWVFIALSVLLCTGAAAAYVLTADKVYEAEADMLVTPVPDDQTAVLGLGLIRRASDPTRDVTTAARLIDNVDVARGVAQELRSTKSPQALLHRISVDPVAQSSIVAITAKGDTPREAQRLANAFGKAAVAERTVQLHRELDPAIKSMRERIASIAKTNAGDPQTQPLYEQLAALESLRSGSDPTLRLETQASAPSAPVSPRTKLSLIGGVFAGLLLGIAGAFAMEALDPRRERQDRLRQLGLSVLANVPDLRRARGGRHAFEESFRFLRTMIRFGARDAPFESIAITSASEQEGKTTTSYQLAFAALEAGQTVVLVEADPYRPGLRGVIEGPDASDRDGRSRESDAGMLEYLSGAATLEEIVKPTAVRGLSFVPAGSLAMGSVTGLLEQERGRAMVGELTELADLVILDCPPVGPRSDAVLIAAVADAVVLVVDLTKSTEQDVTDAVSRLRSSDSHVLGVVLNRDTSSSAEYDYQAGTNGARSSSAGNLFGGRRRVPR
jgi:polysaccharide biosynthesis transport protein